MRLFDPSINELICLVTEVANWKPDLESIKWIASYYITLNHRPLCETNLIQGEDVLISELNLVELYDAPKSIKT